MLFEHNESKYFIFLCVCVFVFLVVSDKCYLLTGRSVLGKIVPEVLTTGTLGRVQFFPIWTDRILYEMFSKRTLMSRGCNYGKVLHELKNF